MSFIELLPVVVVDDVATFVYSVATAAHLTSTLVNEGTLIALLDDGSAISVMIKITTDLMWVEVVLFHIKWSWNFSPLIKVASLEHLLAVVVIDNISSFWIEEVASLIRRFTLFVKVLSVWELATLLIDESGDDIAFLVAL